MNPPVPDRPEAWSLAKLVGFRFAFIYLALYSLPDLVSQIPLVRRLHGLFLVVWDPLVIRVGDLLFGLEVPPRVANGSGDQLISYVEVAFLVLLAGLGTLVWSLLDRKRAAYPQLSDLMRTYLRYLLAFAMLIYGSVKVLKSQFPDPSPVRLLIPIGQTSPMGLLWTFMGYSTFYTVLTGLAEMAGGVLLLFRRTTALGALVVLAVLGNVVALNYSYDVPVKIYSTHLFLMAAILLAPHARRLVDLFLFNRATRPAELGRPLLADRWPRAVRAARLLVVAGMIACVVPPAIDGYRTYGDGAARLPLHGAYQVMALERNGEQVADGDPTGWRRVAISNRGLLVVARDDSLHRFAIAGYRPEGRTLSLQSISGEGHGELTARPGQQHLQLEGVLAGERISVTLRRMEESEFTLLDRGYHWVNEVPYNR